jgi:hypothetical protein
VLQGERKQLVERVVLVAVPVCGGGEACGELVAPLAFHPTLGRPVLELRELRGDTTHIGRAAEDDGVGGVEFSLTRLGFGHRNEAHLDSGDPLGPLGDGLGQGLGVAVARVINDRDIAHADLQILDFVDSSFDYSK